MELISKIDLLHWLLLCRHIGQGHASMLEGKWERSKVWRLYIELSITMNYYLN